MVRNVAPVPHHGSLLTSSLLSLIPATALPLPMPSDAIDTPYLLALSCRIFPIAARIHHSFLMLIQSFKHSNYGPWKLQTNG